MHEPVSHYSVDEEQNAIRKQIEELRKKLPRKPARRKRLPKLITIEEYQKIISHMKKTKEKPEYILSVILAFEAGMRISEIVGLKNKDGSWKVPPLTKDRVDTQGHFIRIESGKGNKDRIVPLPKSVNERALKLLPIKKVGRRSIQRAADRVTQAVLGRKLSFHSFRHGFGSHLASSGRPLHEVQMLMGHSRLDTTGIYLHANPKNALEGARDVF